VRHDKNNAISWYFSAIKFIIMRYTIPKLYCPFEAKIHPMVDQLERYTDIWLREFNLLPNEQAYLAFDQYQFAKMTARTYPDAGFAFLQTASCLNTWLFVVDDALDHIVPGTEKIREKRFLQNLTDDLISILRHNKLSKKKRNLRNPK
jgi:hypothetical protein